MCSSRARRRRLSSSRSPRRGSRASRSARSRTCGAEAVERWRRRRRRAARSRRASRVPTGSNGALVSRSAVVGADAARQEVGPVLRAVEAAHVPVVRVEHDVLARDDVIGGEREAARRRRRRRPRGRRSPGASRSRRSRARRRRSRCRLQPRLDRRVVGRLDDVQVDAVGEEVGAAHEHDDLRSAAASARAGTPRAGAGTARCSSRRCRSRSAGSRRPRAPRRRSRGRCARRAAARRRRPGPRARRASTPASASARVAGSLKSVLGLAALEVGDPHGAVDGGAADRAVARGR